MITTADIAAEIAAEGRTVTLQRVATGVAPVAVTCMAMIRGYKPTELVGGIVQGDMRIVIAATTLTDAGWPAPPKKDDRVIIGSRRTTVHGVETVHIGDEDAKYVIQARG